MDNTENVLQAFDLTEGEMEKVYDVVKKIIESEDKSVEAINGLLKAFEDKPNMLLFAGVVFSIAVQDMVESGMASFSDADMEKLREELTDEEIETIKRIMDKKPGSSFVIGRVVIKRREDEEEDG